MRIVLVLVGFIQALSLIGQDDQVLTFQNYIEIVKTNHPISYQANLIEENAKANERMAKGGFDPKIEGDWDKKSYNDRNYFSVTNGKVKVPTWFGANFNAGYDRSSGDFLDNSDFLPDRGLWNAGISIPLGKGLIIDQRRAELKKAEIFYATSKQEQILLLNELVYNASLAYLDWQMAYDIYKIANEGLILAQERFEGTRSSFVNGDKPAIDTLESFINVQNRQLEFEEAEQMLLNNKLMADNFLWEKGQIPLEIENFILPETININFLSEQIDSISIRQNERLETNPENLLYQYKLDNLNIDQRLAKEDLKPSLQVNYNPLIARGNNSLFDDFSINNYKLGVSFSYSLLQRKERGKLQMTKLKITDTEFDQKLKNQDLSLKLNLYLNNINQINDQYTILNKAVENYNAMLIGENRKFLFGESSLFLVNSRETKYLNSRNKLIKLGNKIIKNRLSYLLTDGRIIDII